MFIEAFSRQTNAETLDENAPEDAGSYTPHRANTSRLRRFLPQGFLRRQLDRRDDGVEVPGEQARAAHKPAIDVRDIENFPSILGL